MSYVGTIELTAEQLTRALWNKGVDSLNRGVYEGTDIPWRKVPKDAVVTVEVRRGGAVVRDDDGGWIADRFGPSLGHRDGQKVAKYMGVATADVKAMNDFVRQVNQALPPIEQAAKNFAEVFAQTVLGINKDRAVQQRLQSALPKGRVMSNVTAATMTRTAAFDLFKKAVVELWRNGDKVVDRLKLSGKPKSKAYAALLMFPKKVQAIGDVIRYASPTYQLQIADRLLEQPAELIRDIMRHEALHVGYPRHDRNFREMAVKNRIPLTEDWTTDPGFHVQRKEGSRYKTIRTFETEREALQWGKQQAREDREHRYRISSSAVGQDWFGPNGQRYRIVEDTGDGWRVEIQHKSSDLPAEESWTFSKQQFERMKESLPLSPVGAAAEAPVAVMVADVVPAGAEVTALVNAGHVDMAYRLIETE